MCIRLRLVAVTLSTIEKALEFIVAGHCRYDDSGAVQSTLVRVVNGQRTMKL